MFTIWYFDGDEGVNHPEFIYKGESKALALMFLQDRFGECMFPDSGSFQKKLKKAEGDFIWELPADSRLVVLDH